MSKNLRKVCVVVASRANYARIKHLMKAIQNSEHLELQLVVGASAMLYKFGRVYDVIRQDGFEPDYQIHYLVEGENLATQAKSTGLGIIELSTAFDSLKPDVVVTVADRFETMATAIAASYLNIPLAHVQGGEISGNIDDSVRHAITKLSHLHYPATEQSAERVRRMGEESWRVHWSGCPSIDILINTDLRLPEKEYFETRGTGRIFEPSEPYILVLQHPVTTSFGHGAQQISETMYGLKDIPLMKVVLWPNSDAGSDDLAKSIREFQNTYHDLPFSYHINFKPEIFAALLANAKCLVGNSSSFIREGSYLGTPAVIVGDRQAGREHGQNVVFANYDRKDIQQKVIAQVEHGHYPVDHLFGDGTAGERIARHLETIDLNIMKRCTY
ncbi:UDP-N-acetylglucosamine 2-epimerase [Methylomonas methanica]|uniref:UDP-N-acetyl-D-glucosamine 2-epimerase, UDP-hydrolysing n=1 Tax=Methylomonas methanica (strain DSM 25384 / MC09) TaxID=857087 RepID=F9ZWC0_METMM|nr:UDP-N-acetylglucosamine 2-epimerase [Methylomonas methanica]AEF99589.1 UDP-N-acetyl-D-glucosamine 2-epimerase, UDP-hydrolysing [Methylomonas methanica MC09]